MKIGKPLDVFPLVPVLYLRNVDNELKCRIYKVLHIGIRRSIALNLEILKENENWEIYLSSYRC